MAGDQTGNEREGNMVKTILSFAQKASFHTILLVGGIFFVFVAVFHIDDISKVNFTANAAPIKLILVVGLLLMLTAICAFLLSLLIARESKVVKTAARISSGSDRVVAQLGQDSFISVILGRIELAVSDPMHTLVVLPANEYFNDECINDLRSSLGAFVQTKFPGRTQELIAQIRLALQGKPARAFKNNEATIYAYGLGTAVFLEKPLGEPHRILLAAATTEQDGKLRGDVAALFTIVREANRVAMTKKLPKVVLPLIGSGYGSICPEHALIIQLLAWSELLYGDRGRKLSVEIVIFRSDSAAKPAISLESMANLVRVATASCAGEARD